MNSPTADIKDILEAEGIGYMGAVSGWGIYIGEEPAQPINVITLFDFAVRPPTVPINNTILADGSPTAYRPGVVEYSGIQARVRASEYAESYAKCEEIKKALTSRGAFESADGSAQYLNIFLQSDALPLGEDDKTRHIFTINFMAPRTPTVVAL